MKRQSALSRVTPFAVIAALVLVLALVPAALAGRGGRGGGGGGTPGGGTPSATLYSSCNPCAAGTIASFWGSGYDGSLGSAQLSVGGTWAAVPVASDGTVAFAWNLSAAGTYDVKLYQAGNGRKMVLKGQLTVVAQ
jgi:hypothetical protein